MKYMKRVSSELENIAGSPEEEELMLQGVRFAFRVHQVRTDPLAFIKQIPPRFMLHASIHARLKCKQAEGLIINFSSSIIASLQEVST